MKEYLPAIVSALERADPVLGGAAPWVAVALVLATALLVSPDERRSAKVPAWLLLVHFVLVGALAFTPEDSPIETSLRLLAIALLMASVARSTFLLFVHSFWMRRFARPLPKILSDVIQGVIFAVALLVVFRSAGVEPGSLLTTSALLTAVIGLSLQDTLGNLFAGLAIQAQRPFTVGDWVQFDAKTGNIGRVIEINWRATRVITLERLEITVPNGALAKSSITNFSRPTHLVRRQVEVQAPYDAAPASVRRVLLASMNHVPGVIQEPAPRVFATGFSERGVTYAIRYFIERFEEREIIDSAVHERVWYSMQRAGISIPVPRRQVELARAAKSQTTEKRPSVEATFDLFRKLSLFEALPDESLRSLAAQCRRTRYTSEEIIVRRGDSSTEMYLVESGRVRIEVRGEGPDQEQVLGRLGPGDFFGEMSLMTGRARTADVIADEETIVLCLDRAAVQPALDQHPELAEHMSRVLAERQVRLDSIRVKEPVHEEGEHDELEILRRIRRFFTP